MLRVENVLDRAENVGLTVPGAYDRMLLHIGTNEVGRGTMRIHVVGSILGVIFDDDDQGVFRIWAVRHSLNQQADSVIVVRLLQFRSIDSSQRLREIPGVIVT